MGSVMGQLGSSLLGTNSKAILIISDKRKAPDTPLSPAEKLAAANKAAGLVSKVNFKALAGMTGSEKMFQVQFNPNTLTLHSEIAPPQATSTEDRGQAATQESVAVAPARVSLRLQLIFDDVTVPDAFMAERLSLNPRDLAAVLKWQKNKAASVRPEVEGLLAAIQSPLTREMTFCWAKFMFKGTLNSINATYTMFNTKGEPIRGTADLRLEQIVEKKLLQQWREDFSAMFGPAGRMGAGAGS
jgi:hypothetical protein